MRKAILLSVAMLLVSVPVYAQGSPTGIGYIPGMPVPQAAPAASSAPSASGGSAEGSAEGGSSRVMKVSKAGDGAQSQNASAKSAPKPADSGVVTGSTGDVNSEGNRAGYGGVTPPIKLEPENKAVFSKTNANQLSWIGFMPEEKSHRIFLQTSKPTTYERVASASDRVEIIIADTKLKVSNNHRELDMSYFQTPFLKAQAMQKGRDVRVVIQLKEAVECRIEQHDNIIDIIAAK